MTGMAAAAVEAGSAAREVRAAAAALARQSEELGGELRSILATLWVA